MKNSKVIQSPKNSQTKKDSFIKFIKTTKSSFTKAAIEAKETQSSIVAKSNSNSGSTNAMKEYERTIAELTQKLNEKKKSNESLKHQIADTQKALDDMKGQVDSKNAEISRVDTVIASYEESNRDLRKEIEKVQKETVQNQLTRNAEMTARRIIARRIMENHVLNLMMHLHNEEEDERYPNVDNMTYEELLELEERIGNVSKGLDQEKIKKIPTRVFNSKKYEEDKCVVCQFEFVDGEKVQELPCKHIFHKDCIEQWLKDQKVCPSCKKEIVIK